MKIQVLCVGKTNHPALHLWLPEYLKRLKHYIRIDWIELQELKNTKNLKVQEQKEKEAEKIHKHLLPTDILVLFDERGQELNSKKFAAFIQKKMNTGIKNLVFVVGGPYGFSESVYERAQHRIALSKMTFSHQMVRIFAVEQLYRAFSILHNEPYHHE